MRHLQLFAGINGFGLAADWMGWEQVAHCEIDDFCQTVIKHYWPNSKAHYDIKKTDFKKYRGTVELICGGFPCQPYSAAGKRKGKEDERHLWPEMLRAIKEVRPRWVVGENVRGLVNWSGGLVFNEVHDELEAQGYKVWAVLVPAASVNAPHRRDRIWFIAYRESESGRRQLLKRSRQREFRRCNSKRLTPYTNRTRLQKARPEQQATRFVKRGKLGNNVANTNGRRQSGKKYRQTESRRIAKKSVPNDWENFPTQPPVCDGDDGLSTRLDGITFPKWRNESIKAGGNAIVPQVALQIFKAIEEYENLNSKR